MSKEVAWCRHCGHQLRPRSILGNWQMCLNCGARGNHYTYDEVEAKKARK